MTYWKWLVGLVVLIGAVASVSVYWVDVQPKVPATATAQYVGYHTCVDCHQQQHQQFLESHHHQALARATQETVLANFDDQVLEHDGLTSRFYRDGDKYLVQTDGPDGKMASFQVLYVLAYHPLQQYMVRVLDANNQKAAATQSDSVDPWSEMEKQGLSALQVLRLCWDVDQKRWFYLRPEDVPEKLDPADPLHWTGVTQRWNTSCAACHSTNLKKNFDAKTNQFHTTFTQIDVGCESCHGPGSLHVEIAQKRWMSWDPVHGKGLFSLKNATASQQMDACASCHSRRRLLAEDFHQTRELHDHLIYEPMRTETYFVDGQIKDEDYVYGSFLQSKMHQKGIRCTDCHNPHTGKIKYPGNQLCTSCHQHPAGTYDSPQHHVHKVGSPGSQCVECHMPHRTYMDVDPRRDHSIRVPRPDLSVKLGVPNACTGCHLEIKNVPEDLHPHLNRYQDWQRLATEGNADVRAELERVDLWAKQIVDQWRQVRGKPIADPHFGELLAAVRSLKPEDRSEAAENSRKQLMKIATDVTQSPMYRVTVGAEMSSWRDEKSLEAAKDLLEDTDGEVVFFAMQRLQSEIGRRLEYMGYGGSQQVNQAQLEKLVRPIVGHLNHRLRLVRNQAASTLSTLPESLRNEILGTEIRLFENAVDELIQVHLLNEELAAVGDLYQSLGNWGRAKEYYRLAVQHAPHEFGARTNLAVLLDEEMRARIQDLQRQSMASPATAGQLKQQMELVREQAQETALEIDALRTADFKILETEVQRSGHLPTAGDIHYRYAMALYLRGEMEKAGDHLRLAAEKNPDVEAYLLGLATYYQATREWSLALPLVQRLRELDPQHPGYQALLQNLEQQQAEEKDAQGQ